MTNQPTRAGIARTIELAECVSVRGSRAIANMHASHLSDAACAVKELRDKARQIFRILHAALKHEDDVDSMDIKRWLEYDPIVRCISRLAMDAESIRAHIAYNPYSQLTRDHSVFECLDESDMADLRHDARRDYARIESDIKDLEEFRSAVTPRSVMELADKLLSES